MFDERFYHPLKGERKMTTTKAAPDYSKTAENLCNPDEVKELLDRLHEAQTTLAYHKDSIPTKIAKGIEKAEQDIADITAQVKDAVEVHGSFQDIGALTYAVKYRRMIKSYDPVAFRECYSQYAPAVIVESVNAKALEGLIKGNLLTYENLINHSVITETPQFAFFVR